MNWSGWQWSFDVYGFCFWDFCLRLLRVLRFARSLNALRSQWEFVASFSPCFLAQSSSPFLVPTTGLELELFERLEIYLGDKPLFLSPSGFLHEGSWGSEDRIVSYALAYCFAFHARVGFLLFRPLLWFCQFPDLILHRVAWIWSFPPANKTLLRLTAFKASIPASKNLKEKRGLGLVWDL